MAIKERFLCAYVSPCGKHSAESKAGLPVRPTACPPNWTLTRRTSPDVLTYRNRLKKELVPLQIPLSSDAALGTWTGIGTVLKGLRFPFLTRA